MKTYDPKDYPLVFNGILIEGFADGTFITIEETAPGFSSTVGAYGDVVHARSWDRRGTCRFTVQQTSEVNKRLSDMYNADRDGVVSGVGEFSLSSKNGDTLHQGSKARLVASPPGTFDATPGTREWTIEIADLQMVHAGQADD